MISVEQIFEDRFSALNRRSPIIRNSFLHWMKLLFHEAEFRQFEADHPQLQGLEFVEAVLEYFEFGFTLNPYERERIPKDGPAIIVSNHPIGSLDGLALLQLVSEVRSDVKVVANELLYALKPLRPLLLPVDNMNGNTRRENTQNIETHISSGGALIIFPAGEVSRLGTKGIRDGRWRSGALRFAEKTKAPIVPVHISARNSMLFYAMSLLARPLSTLLLIDEMFRQTNRTVRITIGAAIDYENLASMPLSRDARSALLRSHELGVPLSTDLTVTGGMPFGGGPLNNFVLQATAKLAQCIRAKGSGRGLVSSVSGMNTKQGFGLWSAQPEAEFHYMDVSERVASESEERTLVEPRTGEALVLAITVLFDRGEPQRAVAIVEYGSDRSVVSSDQPAVMECVMSEECVGRRIMVNSSGQFTFSNAPD